MKTRRHFVCSLILLSAKCTLVPIPMYSGEILVIFLEEEEILSIYWLRNELKQNTGVREKEEETLSFYFRKRQINAKEIREKRRKSGARMNHLPVRLC